MAKCVECPPEGAPGWMVTYGDLMTLLLCFFVLLFSFSSLDVVVMMSLKKTFTGAYGLMQGHSAIDGVGVSQLPQKYSSKLFDMAMEKVRKAKSDKFPRERLQFLNSMEIEMNQAIGMIQQAVELGENNLDQLDNLKATVQEKVEDDSTLESNAMEDRVSVRDYMAKTIDPQTQESISEREELKLAVAPADVAAKKMHNDIQQQRSYSDQPVSKVLLARGDEYLQNSGDASRNRKLVGRNMPSAGNPGENELEDLATGQKLKDLQRMDRVDGQGQKKRFDYPVPRKEFSTADQINVSGEVRESQSDANRSVQTSVILDTDEIFYKKSARIKEDELTELRLRGVVELLLANLERGYFQIESYTDSTRPAERFANNRELTLAMSIALIEVLQRLEPRFKPSSFAAVGWGAAKGHSETQKRSLRPENRIEIRFIKPKF